MLTLCVATFAQTLLAVTLLLAVGCLDTEVDSNVEYEQVVIDYGDVSILDGNLGMDDIGSGPCSCGDNYACLSEWADDNFACGVCASIACGSYTADICTDLCAPAPVHGRQGLDTKR
mgnify:CR=1 FL=1